MEVYVVEGPDAGRTFALSGASVIGRDPTAVVHLTDDEVSRRHAIISVGDDGVTIEDLGSVNGTHLPSGQVHGEAPLQLGERIRVGQSTLELREPWANSDPEALKPTKTSMPRLP